ncbi:virulence protein [Abditibacteriota bacterium]|nr:virulence protein [Abditibacteriota bacterium]
MKTYLDHAVVAVSQWQRSNDFYARVLGAEVVARGQGFAYRFGNAQLNLHGPGVAPTPVARLPVVPGNSDLCFRFDGTIDEARAHLETCGVEIELGPVERSGFGGAGHSLYFRDPDGTLLEFLVLPETTRALNPITLENEWVRLEPLRLHHLDALWEVGQDPCVWEHFWLQFRVKDDMESFIHFYLKREEQQEGLAFAVWDKTHALFVGATTFLDFQPTRRAVEIGSTWLGHASWGSLINPAMKFLMLQHAFESLGLMRVQLKTDIRNLRSQRAMEKLGATREGTLRKNMQRPDGSWRDSVYFSIVDDEWPQVKLHLQERLR